MADSDEFTDEYERLVQKNDNDDDDFDPQKFNQTRYFQPGAASTLYHGGEENEMETMQHEQSGLPDISYDETTL